MGATGVEPRNELAAHAAASGWKDVDVHGLHAWLHRRHYASQGLRSWWPMFGGALTCPLPWAQTGSCRRCLAASCCWCCCWCCYWIYCCCCASCDCMAGVSGKCFRHVPASAWAAWVVSICSWCSLQHCERKCQPYLQPVGSPQSLGLGSRCVVAGLGGFAVTSSVKTAAQTALCAAWRAC